MEMNKSTIPATRSLLLGKKPMGKTPATFPGISPSSSPAREHVTPCLDHSGGRESPSHLQLPVIRMRSSSLGTTNRRDLWRKALDGGVENLQRLSRSPGSIECTCTSSSSERLGSSPKTVHFQSSKCTFCLRKVIVRDLKQSAEDRLIFDYKSGQIIHEAVVFGSTYHKITRQDLPVPKLKITKPSNAESNEPVSPPIVTANTLIDSCILEANIPDVGEKTMSPGSNTYSQLLNEFLPPDESFSDHIDSTLDIPGTPRGRTRSLPHPTWRCNSHIVTVRGHQTQ